MPYSTFGFAEEQVMVRDSVPKPCEDAYPLKEIEHSDDNCLYPEKGYRALAAAGWLAYPFSEEFGGSNASHKDLAVFLEAVSYHIIGLVSAVMTTVVYCGQYLAYFGTEEQKKRLLPGLIAGDIKMAIAYTEPDTGSDAVAIRTRAVPDGDDFIINSQKVYITNAHIADCLVVTTKTDPDAGHKGLTLFLVDAKSPGITVKPMGAMGRRTSRPNEVFFDNVRVPAANVLGGVNEAWKKMMRGLNLERVMLAAVAAGQCLKILEVAKNYTSQRTAFGKVITEYQAVSHRLADMRMMTESARLHTWSAAAMLDAGMDAVLQTSMAKVVATEANVAGADLGVQVMGGAGHIDGEMSRMYRDARITTIGGGTSEIMRNVIAHRFLRG